MRFETINFLRGFMMKVRQDAWMKENDDLLAQAVLRHVKEGSSQLNAFEEAGDLLSRTAAACGFRWNAVVRKMYETELAHAKQQRKEKMRVLQSAKKRSNALYYSGVETKENNATISLSSLSLDIVIAYLMRMQHLSSDGDSIKWRHIANTANERVHKLEQQIERLKRENQEIRTDYEQFVQIMNRARKLVAFDSVEEPAMPSFKMERNGNLVANFPASLEEENVDELQ